MRLHRYAIDAFVVLWLVSMLGLGAVAMRTIDGLATTADSFSEIAQEEDELASALAPLESLPVAGGQIAPAVQQLREASAKTAVDAQVSGDSIHRLARIVFALVALIALFPVVALYLPSRASRAPLRPAPGERRAPA